MARNTTEFEYGDKVVILEITKHGPMIKRIGIVLGVGWGYTRNANKGSCFEGLMNTDPYHPDICENSRYMIVAVPMYDSDTGSIMWRRYSAKKANVALDRQSIREIDEITRAKFREENWKREVDDVERHVDERIALTIIREVFSLDKWRHMPEHMELAQVLVKYGAHPPVDREAYIAQAIKSRLVEFNKTTEEAAPTDF